MCQWTELEAVRKWTTRSESLRPRLGEIASPGLSICDRLCNVWTQPCRPTEHWSQTRGVTRYMATYEPRSVHSELVCFENFRTLENTRPETAGLLHVQVERKARPQSPKHAASALSLGPSEGIRRGKTAAESLSTSRWCHVAELLGEIRQSAPAGLRHQVHRSASPRSSLRVTSVTTIPNVDILPPRTLIPSSALAAASHDVLALPSRV
jgi:hypothetical protein